MDVYEPRLPRLAIVKSRLSPEAWTRRVDLARAAAEVMERISGRVRTGQSLNAAIAAEVDPSRRSWVIHNWRSFQRDGFEALIDARLPREPRIAREIGPMIEMACEANPAITAEEVLAILVRRKVKPMPSMSTLEKHMARVRARRRYAEKKRKLSVEIVELPFAGGELLRAAELETKAVETLVNTVDAISKEALEASTGQEPQRDIADRDANGHFTATYNEKRRRKEDEPIASYLRSAAEKAEGRVLSWPRFVHERRETVEAKLWTLTLAPLVSSTQGWNALRAAEVEGVGSLTGFAYRPSTLSKFTSALAISGAGPRLLESLGMNWHNVAQARWGESGSIAALYIDNTTKAVWSSLFTKSGKVSSLNRIMPCITTTYVHTGAGTPIAVSVQSGSAPLAPRLVQLVAAAEARLEVNVERAVIIDAEGSTFDILDAFAKAKRIIVTPLRPSRAPELELRYSRGSYFRPYREHDELRIATAELVHKSTGRSLSVGALIVRRDHREQDSVLLTTGLELGMEGRDLADLYFARWPIQENSFRKGLTVGLNRHKGNCGRMVANSVVITELEQIERRLPRNEALRADLIEARSNLEQRLRDAEHACSGTAARTMRQQLEALVAKPDRDEHAIADTAVIHQAITACAESSEVALSKAREQLEANEKRTAKVEADLAKDAQRRTKLEPRRTIRQLDTALDSILTATKLTLGLLISFVLREYFPGLGLGADTFASRIFSLRGRRELSDAEERIVFYENPRDPEINAAIAKACERLNQRPLARAGLKLSYALEPTPKPPGGRGRASG